MKRNRSFVFMIQLAILDDHKLVRKGFCIMLNNIADFNVILETDNEDAIEDLIKINCPDVLLLDISMPKTNGLDLIAKFLKINKDLKIIILTMHREGEYIVRAATNGAFAYLLKDIEPDELETAIRSAKDGKKHFSPHISQLLINNISKPKEIGILSIREKQVLQFVASGLSTKLIAKKLCLSIRTIEVHRMNLMKKIKSFNTSHLIRKAMEYKLVE